MFEKEQVGLGVRVKNLVVGEGEMDWGYGERLWLGEGLNGVRGVLIGVGVCDSCCYYNCIIFWFN